MVASKNRMFRNASGKIVTVQDAVKAGLVNADDIPKNKGAAIAFRDKLRENLGQQDRDRLLDAASQRVGYKLTEKNMQVSGVKSEGVEEAKGKKKGNFIKQNIREYLDGRQSLKSGYIEIEGKRYDVYLGEGRGNLSMDMKVTLKREGKTVYSLPWIAMSDKRSVSAIGKDLNDYFKAAADVTKDLQLNPFSPAKQKKAKKTRGAFVATTKGTYTGSADNDARLFNLRSRKNLTAQSRRLLTSLEKKAAADPAKWKSGQGVGWKPVQGQINRGFRVIEVDEPTKMAKIRQVADTGITKTGGVDRINDQWVHVAELITDNKYSQ